MVNFCSAKSTLLHRKMRAILAADMAAQRLETDMTTISLDFPAALARVWVDNSIQIMKTTTDLWVGLLLPSASERTLSSTASPWWMPPQQTCAPPSAPFWPAAFGPWMPGWPQAMARPTTSGADSFLPWLPSTRTASTGNPFALWQQMWFNVTAPAIQAPWSSDSAPVANELWQPVATVYRTANGHAMAAVLRTMADVVEPKTQGFTPAHYWPSTLGSRH